MAGLGRKTFNSGDVLNAADVQGYLMDQAVMVFAGTAARGSAIPTPSAGMVAYSTATQLQVYDGSAWVDLSTGYGAATGGSSSSITVGGTAYTLLTFTSSGTLTVTKSGLFDCLVVGGGASGGFRTNANVPAGGGGGGAVVQQTIYLTSNQTVTIGAKGAAQTSGNTSGNQGTVSKIGSLAAGGGGGGAGTDRDNPSGQGRIDNAGSGGGSHGSITDGAGLAVGVTLVGIGANNGGSGGWTTNIAGGGGGGSTQVGQNNSGNTSGNGGTGTDVSTFIGGSALYHGAGGGGGGTTAGGTAGNSTGGNGSTGTGSNATATNYGCGGGGGMTGGGAGSDGVVYVRFRA